MAVGRLLSYWEGNFSGAMLNLGGVSLQWNKQKNNFRDALMTSNPAAAKTWEGALKPSMLINWQVASCRKNQYQSDLDSVIQPI